MKNTSTRICIISMMSSMVLLATFIRVPIPIGSVRTVIHLGNAFCLLSGFLLGPFDGGLSSGIGSLIFDFTFPGYMASAPFTFLFKFIMGAICGSMSKRKNTYFGNVIAASIGAISYIILNAIKNFFKNMYLLGMPIQANLLIIGQGLIIPIINGILSVVISVTLFNSVKTILKSNKYFKH